jgi:hypothetical protein
MAKPKKKMLPKDFESLLSAGDVAAVRAVFDTCDVNAYGGATKRTALAFNDLPDDVARWLVENGADIAAPDSYGETPLHHRAGHWQGRIEILLELGADVHITDSRGNTPLHDAAEVGNIHTARVLLEHGANIDAVNNSRLTPLAYALQRCSNARIEAMADMAALLLPPPSPAPSGLRKFTSRLFGAGEKGDARITDQMRDFVKRIGENFEFHRQGYDPESRDAASAALDRLYDLFDVPPVPRRAMHDGRSRIVAKADTWQDRHQELWELLVPSSGAADTVQGEVIRISGRIARELDGNGGINWRDDYRQMADALLAHLGSGKPLQDGHLKEAAAIVSEVKRKFGDTQRLCELSVEWVAQNPKPIPLPAPAYAI